jgi:hypothetical protein
MKWLSFPVLLLLLSGCNPKVEKTHPGGIDRLIDTQDGIILVWARYITKEPMIDFMYHGPRPVVREVWSAYKMTERNGVFETKAFTLDHIWEGEDSSVRPPLHFIHDKNKLIPHYCAEPVSAIEGDKAVCRPADPPSPVGLIGSHREAVFLRGSQLFFPSGTDSPNQCSVDLASISPETALSMPARPQSAVAAAVRALNGEVRTRFAVSHTAPGVTYLIDYASNNIDIFRLECGEAKRIAALLDFPALRARTKDQSFRISVKIADLVVAAGDAMPTLLLSWNEDADSVIAERKYAVILSPNAEMREIVIPQNAVRTPSFWLGRPNQILQSFTSAHKGNQGQVTFVVQDIETGKTELLQTSFMLNE